MQAITLFRCSLKVQVGMDVQLPAGPQTPPKQKRGTNTHLIFSGSGWKLSSPSNPAKTAGKDEGGERVLASSTLWLEFVLWGWKSSSPLCPDNMEESEKLVVEQHYLELPGSTSLLLGQHGNSSRLTLPGWWGRRQTYLTATGCDPNGSLIF